MSRRSPRERRRGRTSAAAIATAVVIGAGAGVGVAGTGPAPGASQSPIDIRADEVAFVKALPPLDLDYPRRTDVTLVNTGSPGEEATIRADVPAGAAHATLGGVRYDLIQFHWHTPAEHELEGRRGPLEMHLVHRAADGSLLVVGVLMEEGAPNPWLGKVFRALPERPGQSAEVRRVSLTRLLPRERVSFRYPGSLTTPPFTEGVSWVVLADEVHVSERQVDAFRELFEEGNSREVQPLNGRTVVSDAGRPHGATSPR